jgi:hypothetical protein
MMSISRERRFRPKRLIAMTPQLSLWSSPNQAVQPLPLQVAADYAFPLQYHVQGDDTIVYAVQDWIAGLTGEVDPKKVSRTWDQFKRQSSISNGTLKLPYKARDGKTYKRDFAPDTVLYQFAAYARAMKDRPQIAEIKDFLAKAGAFVDELRQDPESIEVKAASLRQRKAVQSGKDETWQVAREMGVITRKQFTAMLYGLNQKVNMGRATNEVYEGVFGTTAQGLRKLLNIGPKENPRDHMSRLGLGYTMIAEEAARVRLTGYADDDALPLDVIDSTITTVARAIGLQAQEMAQLIGIDLVTGKAVLTAGS